MDLLKYEQKYWNNGVSLIAGIDEAGRGPLSGPVVAAAVIFDEGVLIDGINDSKKISEKKREILYPKIQSQAKSIGIGVVHEDEIDELNILQATFLAMRKALGNLNVTPQQVLVDGPYTDIKQIKTECVVNGDSKSHSIAAASIIAKVYRDRIMYSYSLVFPEYEFINNKGYGTKKHIEAIEENKSSPIHRKSFKIVKENLPTYKFINDGIGLDNLASKITICNYVKNNYTVLETKFSNEGCCFDSILNKNNELYFILVEIADASNNQINKIDKKYYFEKINEYLIEKDIRNEFTFIVNFVEFIKNKKPNIKSFEIN